MSILLHQVAELSHLCERRPLIAQMVACIGEWVHATSASYLTASDDVDDVWTCVERYPADLLAQLSEWATTEILAGSEQFSERVEAIGSGCTRTYKRGDMHLTVIPFRTDEERRGVIELETADAVEKGQADQIMSVLQICRSILRLLNRGDRDSLTKLFNRKTFDSTFSALARNLPGSGLLQSVERRKPRGLWLAMFDADHFKRVNDTHGHLVGDEVLIGIAAIMTTVFRGDEHVFRFGGEEFVALIPADSKIKVMSRLESIRAKTEAHEFTNGLRVTLSAGVTAVRGGERANDAICRADKAVYAAKRLGRNKVVFDDEEEGYLSSESQRLAPAAP